MRPRQPLWLATPSRWAGLARGQARLILGTLAVLVLLSLTALIAADPTAAGAAARDGSDLQLYSGVVEAIRHGGSYYPVTAEALRIGHYPLRPFVTFRLPTLAVAQAWLPAAMVPMLLYALAIGVVLAWYDRFREAFTRPLPRVVALLLLAGGSIACWQAELAPFHEIWAGLLIALSLARYRTGAWLEAVGWGLTAALIRETSALYLLVMATLAWRESDRRQAAAWGAAILVLLTVVAAHGYGVAQVVTVADPRSPGWAGLLGPGYVVRTWQASTALSLLPLALAAPLVALALAGWTAWASPVATRAATTLGAYALLLGVAGRLDTFYWGLLTAPVLLIGLAFAPDGLRDLIAAALDRRRIVVRRVSL
ncbi:hypothetical protein [Sphingomonas sp.]|uniref:hypothetical protein n=1 Tax=Sphingomonas sp. TaxID=28214 RepID=UPI003B0099E6